MQSLISLSLLGNTHVDLHKKHKNMCIIEHARVKVPILIKKKANPKVNVTEFAND